MKNNDKTQELQIILKQNKNKRVLIIGTTCIGKSTFSSQIKNSLDMDEIIFPFLTPEEKRVVCQDPWTEEIGKYMTSLVRKYIKIEKGKPLFGTVLLDCDLIILLKISNKILKERCDKRKTNFKNAVNMQNEITKEVNKCKIPKIIFDVD